jgi:hypothetical protein
MLPPVQESATVGLGLDPKARPWNAQARKYLEGLLLATELSSRGVDENTPESGLYCPALTTVRMEFEEVGRRCVDRLLDLVHDLPLETEAASTTARMGESRTCIASAPGPRSVPITSKCLSQALEPRKAQRDRR